MEKLRLKLKEDLKNVGIERDIKARVVRELDDITLVVKALTDNYYKFFADIYMGEIKRRAKGNRYSDIQSFFVKTLDSVLGKEEYYSYGLKLQKKRIPEL